MPQPEPQAPSLSTFLRSRAVAYWTLARFDKPVGILLLLWPTWWGLWLAAQGLPDWPRLLVFTVGTILMRAAGCVLNDLADRRFDGAVARTSQRRLATGSVSVLEALGLALVLLACSASLLVFLNDLARQYAYVAVFVAAAYPYFKRFFPMPQAVLGIAFGFGIPMAFADTHGQVPLYAWWLWLANVAWSIAYDTAYAMVDRDDDLRLGLRSSAITFGRLDVLAVAVFQSFVLLTLLALPFLVSLGLVYGLAWVAATVWSYRLLLRLRSRSREDSFWVFRQSHWVGAVIWLGLALDLML